jgi:hypothetical protein
MRRYASVRGVRYGSLWFGSPGSGVRRFASPSPAGGGTGPDMARILPGSRSENTGPSHNVALCRAMARAGGSLGCSAMFRLTGSGGPGRISSGTAAGSAALPSHCFASGGIFFREPGRLPGAGARIRAGKGSVRAPDVPVPVTVYGLVQVARYGAVAVPHALSHCPTVKYGVSL